jgi:hypothetical protein
MSIISQPDGTKWKGECSRPHQYYVKPDNNTKISCSKMITLDVEKNVNIQPDDNTKC